MNVDQEFVELAMEIASPRVLELGAKRSQPERCTSLANWVPHAREVVGADCEPGLDVDVVCDAHDLAAALGTDSFDIVIARAVFEHFREPWTVARQIALILKPGGLVYVQTHQTFPLHGFPDDYWRFSTAALESLFSESRGFGRRRADYQFPCKIVRDDAPGMMFGPAFLNTNLVASKGVAHSLISS